MKKMLGICLIFLSGCETHWVHTPAPTKPLAMQTASIASGVLLPQDFYFTFISQYEPDQQHARVIILTEPALKLADLTVSNTQIQIHERAPKVPNRFIQAWAELTREQFLLPCPARKIVQKIKSLQGTFELEVTGGVCQ